MLHSRHCLWQQVYEIWNWITQCFPSDAALEPLRLHLWWNFLLSKGSKKFLSIFKYEIALFLSQIRVETLADSSVSRQEVTYAVLISFYFISLLSFRNSSIVKPFFFITDIKQNSRVYTKSFSSVLHSKEKVFYFQISAAEIQHANIARGYVGRFDERWRLHFCER